MARISFDGFRDPIRRPRYLIWTFVVLLVLAAVMVVALGVTSTRWFCSEACHKVQDDTITAYNHSAHKQVSCMACHMPVGASPVVFILHKAEALAELALTVTNRYELPLNGESLVALEMPSEQCTQCHNTAKREMTPSEGIIIDHDIHATKGVNCAICHNRTAHREDFKLTLTDPATQEPNKKHDDYMLMTSCFRCHTQEQEGEGPVQAPGKCSVCHPKDFKLTPDSHLQEGFFPEGHAKLYAQEESRVAQAEAAESGESSATHESGAEEATAEETGAEGASSEEELTGAELGEALADPDTIIECYTCHAKSFCTDCHGVEMPHPADFKEEHGALGKKDPKTCENCHGSADVFCDECHHGSSLEWQYNTKEPWRTQHPQAVKDLGAQSCLDECHGPTYCSECHVSASSGQ